MTTTERLRSIAKSPAVVINCDCEKCCTQFRGNVAPYLPALLAVVDKSRALLACGGRNEDAEMDALDEALANLEKETP